MAQAFKLSEKAKAVAVMKLDTRRFQAVVLVLLLYTVALIPGYRLIGDAVFFLSLAPLTLAAGLLGVWPALLVAVLLSILNLYLYDQLGATWTEWAGRGGASALLHLIVGAGVGRLADLQARLKNELQERNEIESKLEYLAYHDPLTGLPNRLLFTDHLERELAHARRQKQHIGVLAVNLERFRRVNDSFGHDVGDRLLTEVGERIKRAVRQSDTVARLGSDTFVVLLPKLRSGADIAAISEKIQTQVAQPLFISRQEIQATCRIGMAQFPEDGEDPETLLRNAGAALNRAKQNATQTFQAYNPQINSAARERMQLETGIRRALQQEELSVHYQPIVDTATGGVVSFEALLRWHSPALGDIPPDTFIPVAEDTGAIHAIGDWVFRTALRQLRKWQELGFSELRMGVNISPKQLRRATLAQEMLAVAAEVGVAAHHIELEITESSLLKQETQVMENLRRFREAGMELAVDDFGTGYSCLAYLKRMPFTCLKVDRSFIRQVNTDPEYASITYAIIAIAKALRMRTIAEGVETQEQCSYLWQLQCDAVQGYLFNKPMPANDCTRMLADILERRQAFMSRQGESKTGATQAEAATTALVAKSGHETNGNEERIRLLPLAIPTD